MYSMFIIYFILGFFFGLIFDVDIDDMDKEDDDYETFKQENKNRKK